MAKKKIKTPIKKADPMDKQLIWIIATMVIAILCLLAIPIINNSKNTVKYDGLKFQKVKYGQLDVYYYPYQFNYSGKSYGYNLYLRNDPSKSNVGVNGTIEYPVMGSKVYMSFDFINFANCDNSVREVTTLSLFLQGNLYSTNLSSPNITYAKQNNLTFANCTSTKNMVVLLQSGNETRIDRYNNCYVLSAANCTDMLNVVEKFEVQSVADARKNNK
ncbi:MAG: hypothetical protein WCK29_01690 [archaeon]